MRVVCEGREYFAAACLEGPDLAAKIAEYLRTHLNVRVLFADESSAVFVHSSDSGRELDWPDSEFATKGWRSLYAQDSDNRREPAQADFHKQARSDGGVSEGLLQTAAGDLKGQGDESVEPSSPPAIACFDPWVSSYAEAAAQPGGIEDSHDAWKQWCAAGKITENREEMSTYGPATLAGLAIALENGLAPPDWLADAFLANWREFSSLRARSLDEAFGHEPPTNRTLDATRRHSELLPKIGPLLRALITADKKLTVSPELFETAGKTLGISQSLCRELYDLSLHVYKQPNVSVFRKAILDGTYDVMFTEQAASTLLRR